MFTQLDKKILSYIDFDGRASFSKIAEAVGTSPQVVKYHIEALVERKIVKNFWAFCDYNRAGYPVFWGYWLSFQGLTPQKENELMKYLAKDTSIPIVMRSSGFADMMIAVITKDIFEQNEKVQSLLETFSPHITIKEMVIGISFYKFGRKYLADIPTILKDTKRSGTQHNGLELDEIDKKILSLVQLEGRMGFEGMYKLTGIPTSTLRKRYERLVEQGVILRTTYTLDYLRSGACLQRNILAFSSNKERQKEFMDYCEKHPNIVNLVQISGHYNAMLDIEAFDVHTLLLIKQDLLFKFPDFIREYAINDIHDIQKFSQLKIFYPGCLE